jgi:hypothetical protein
MPTSLCLPKHIAGDPTSVPNQDADTRHPLVENPRRDSHCPHEPALFQRPRLKGITPTWKKTVIHRVPQVPQTAHAVCAAGAEVMVCLVHLSSFQNDNITACQPHDVLVLHSGVFG